MSISPSNTTDTNPTLSASGGISSAKLPTSSELKSRQVAADLVGLSDIVAVIIGGLIPSHFYALQGPGVISSGMPALQWSLIVAVIAYTGMRHLNLYDTTKMHDFPVAPGKLFAVLSVALLAVLGIGLPFSVSGPHMWIWYSSWLSATFVFALTNRIIANKILARMTAAGAFDTRVAVYGAGEIAARLNHYLRDPALGIRFAGVFDDRSMSRHRDGKSPLEEANETLAKAGNMEDLIKVGRKGEIDQIVIALPPAALHRTNDIIKRFQQLPVSIHVCTHIASDLVDDTATQSLSKLGPIGLLDVKRKPLSDWQPILKSAEDYILGTALLILAAPIMAIIALAIKLDSPGPVFFRQRRGGLNRQVIEVLKFRTMTVTEDGDQITQAVKDDPRTTRVGRLLRRTSIDELPQLFNVLRGEMSLVGPRPHALAHDQHYDRLLQTYANRHQVKPGITGWAQVNGFRGETRTADMMKQRVKFDLDYIRNWSLWCDLRILARTVLIVFSSKNAY